MWKKHKGNLFEQEASLYYHERFTPVLVSNQLLKKMGAGQIDLAFVKADTLYVLELKQSGIISAQQQIRLKKSAKLLGMATNYKIVLGMLKKTLPKRWSFFNLNL